MSADDAQKSFDVFISYSHKDAEWVRDWLVFRLKQAGVSVCIDEESFDIGVPALINMENAVAASRRTLIVLTPAWVSSQWTRFEGLLIQHDDPAGVLQFTLPLLLEPCDVPKRIDILTRADFTGKKDAEAEFSKLLDAIQGKRRLPDQKNKTKEPSNPSSQNENMNHARTNLSIPRPPEVGFVVRRDRKGVDIVAQLKEELSPQKNQLVALWGDGGVGKTTIAAEAVRELSKVVALRVVWISADGRPEFALSTLLDEIATQLSEPETRRLAVEPKKEAVRELIAGSDRPVLVVLDNFETVSPAEQKRCVDWMDNHAPCPALITTRNRVDGARNVPVDVMSEQEANEFLDRLIEQTQNSEAFERLDRKRIIKAADANPLVMQWIIAQIDLAQHPSDVLDDLARGEGDAAERVFDRSFDLQQIGNDGRDTLLALSLFAPSASRAALTEVAGFGDDVRRVREAVKGLAALCLVQTTSDERWIIEGLTRDLAKARLMRDERATEFCRRFVAYFTQYAESHSETTKEDFDALDAERDNVLTSIDLAFEIKKWESVMQMMIAIGHMPNGFLSVRGHWDEAIQRGEQAVKAAQAMKNEWCVAMFAGNSAIIRQSRGEYERARNLLKQSLNVFRRLGSESNIAAALHQLGMIAQDQGEIEEARRLYKESLEITKKLGDQSGIALTLHQLGIIAQNEGETEEARQLYKGSLEITKKLGDQSVIARTLHQLGRLSQSQGEIEEARRLYDESLEIKKKLGDQSGIAITLGQLGLLVEGESNSAEAARLFREALSIFEKLKSPYAELARRSLERVESKLK
jgi:tetratricopeptide (TPR) repeat protein